MISIKSARTKALATLVAGVAAGATLLVPSAAQATGTAATTATTAAAQTSVTRAAIPDRLLPGQSLRPGHYIQSKTGGYLFIMQTDGNAVLYHGKTALWSTVTGRKGSVLVMQKNGDLEVVSGRTVVWATNTTGSTGAFLAVQGDSNLVIYNTRKKAVWSRAMVIGTLGAGRLLKPGQVLLSVNRVYWLLMQTDGNLVLTRNNKTVLWHTATGKNPGAFAAMQADGNLVVYSAAKHALWSSNTAPRSGSVLQMQDGGSAAIVHGRTVVWSTHTH
jgi:hypothetical protein